ncbi:MAG TPA: MetQ/NlpA family ABC transporter substrate-binding protein [Syntrophomonadaceae bacterium]|nr:MetQ/NlpA family ABC transporter substrate-binding protein [Syntrophomonadaceae bacterium]HNX28666.1 MetQ/NlpA family ABC transporter substrate-binding protein [Syntrophomonadaceae bacterium]HPR93536.1 MetQ/NlpA family ABC transporter substrate-binding protein [Syntrophomonadaceae bacterium]
MKKLFICLLIIICSTGIMACAEKSDNDAENSAVSDKIINIGVMPDVESIPFLIAQKNGYFEQEGVKVNIEHFSSAKDRDSALQSGKLDGVITDMVAVLFANEGGINLRIVAENEGNVLLMAGKDSGISSVAELKGKDLGLSTNTIMEYTVDKMLEDAGLQYDDVSKVAIPPLPTRLEMLQGGKVAAAILPEPMAGLAVKNGAVILNSTENMDNKAGAIAFTAESIAANPEEIKAIFRAYDLAVEYLQTEPAEDYIDFIIEEQSFPAGIKDSLQLPDFHKAEMIREDIFNDVVKWMHDKELIKGNYEFNDIADQNILE